MKLTTTIVICTIYLFHTSCASSWYERKRSHNMKSLRSERIAKISKMSDGKQLEYFKNQVLQPLLTTRVPGSEGNIHAQQHIKNLLTGWHIEEDSFNDSTPLGMKPFTNIIATYNPSATRRLTLACHFDSKYFTEFEFIGATDSAVPCAMLIDLAKHLNDSMKKASKSEITLQLIFFDGEEAFKHWTPTDSIYGARHLCAKMDISMVEVDREVTVSNLEMIDLFVLLDLIGTDTTTFVSFFTKTNKYFERLMKIEMLMAKDNLLEPVQSFKNRKTNRYFTGSLHHLDSGGIQDDHLPFLNKNVPILHLISTPFPKEWHKPEDNASALDFSTINNIGKILRIFVVEYLHLSV